MRRSDDPDQLFIPVSSTMLMATVYLSRLIASTISAIASIMDRSAQKPHRSREKSPALIGLSRNFPAVLESLNGRYFDGIVLPFNYQHERKKYLLSNMLSTHWGVFPAYTWIESFNTSLGYRTGAFLSFIDNTASFTCFTVKSGHSSILLFSSTTAQRGWSGKST